MIELRFAVTEEEKELTALIEPYMKIKTKPFSIEFDENAPEEIKEARKKLQALVAKEIEAYETY